MHAIPQHTRHLIERLLAAYCARICPPTARNTVLIGYRIDEDRVWLDELRRICGVPGTRRNLPVARFRYRAADGCWLLDERDDAGRWRRHRALAPTRSFLELLREVDADPDGAFWGRIDGKSLRWCSSKGRCAACDLRYGEVLGIAVSVPATPPRAQVADRRD